MATLTLGDGRESIVKADRALKEGGQVWVTAPRSSCGQKQPNNQSTVKAPKYVMDHNYYIHVHTKHLKILMKTVNKHFNAFINLQMFQKLLWKLE